jgi:hypothetical protein
MFHSIRWHARALASLTPASILQLAGRLRDSGEEVTALYAGNESNLDFIVTSLFAATPAKLAVRQVSPLLIPQALARLQHHAEIVVVERPPLWAALGGLTGATRIPAWIRQELHLDGNGGVDRWTIGRHLEREAQRHIRRHDYRLVMSDTEADKREFFAEFYLPYQQSRHGAGAIMVTPQRFGEVAAKATLAKLLQAGSWTAGMLLLRQADTLHLSWFGSRCDPPAPGASEVLDVLCIKDAAQRGMRRIDFGHSRPSLVDGVVRYKRKFDAEVVHPRYPQTVIEWQIRTDRPALHEWLANRQFVRLDTAVEYRS